ncbi:hypothetical protein KR018_011103, partial [Drosophila ironensis]
YVTLILCILLILRMQHKKLENWDGLMGSLTQEDLGQNGTAAWLSVPSSEIVAYTQGWQRYFYNAWLAERIPLHRSLPDYRDPRCLKYNYHEDTSRELSPASIVVVFRNEQVMVLLRTLTSLVARTPRYLFKELILVDDCSDWGPWSDDQSVRFLDAYIRRYIYPKARIFHLQEQVGLIRARRYAAAVATGFYLVFLDAHVEVTNGWLLPLLAECLNGVGVATPVLDRLDEQTLAYHRVQERRDIFDWSLRRHVVPLKRNQTRELPQPYELPFIRTSVFAINTKWFQMILDIDGGLLGFGGAELQLSLAAWQTGARIVRVPCSRVGHLEPRSQDYLSRYGNLRKLGNIQNRVSLGIRKKMIPLLVHISFIFQNLKRILEIWVDIPDMKSIFYQYLPHLKTVSPGDLRMARKWFAKCDCESFGVFAYLVMPELLQTAPRHRTALAYGRIQSLGSSSKCLTIDKKSKRIDLKPCKTRSRTQNWTFTFSRNLQINGNLCAEVAPNLSLRTNNCHYLGGSQEWQYDPGHHYLISNNKCLEFNSELRLFFAPCKKSNKRQRWFFRHPN